MNPSHSAVSGQHRRVRAEMQRSDSYAFFNLLTGEELLDDVEALLPAHRERLFPPTETLSMFLAQVLSSDGSCRQAVDDAAVKRLVAGLPECSTNTGSYCAARGRLPQAMVETLTWRTAEVMARDTPSWWLWRNRRVRLVDGTTVTLADTEANQAEYPQPSGQRAGRSCAWWR